MKLRATSFALLILLPATVLLAFAPSILAANGDTFVNGAVSIVPGNPCNALGPAGGVAVKEAGTASVLYYASTNNSKIYFTGAHMPTNAPPPCQGTISPAVAGSAGWSALAYDAYHASVRLWGARADGTGTIVGMTLAGTVVATIPGTGPVTGLAVNEGLPHDLYVSTGSSVVRKYTVTGTPTLSGSVSYPHGVSHLAAWSGALITADNGDWIRNHLVDGTWLGLLFHPGDTYVDAWFQYQRYYRYADDIAFDDSTYAATGKQALWAVSTEGGNFCVSQCPVSECTQYEGPQCISWVCVQWCNGEAIYQYTVWPTLRAFEVKRTCPGGQNVPPTQECVCPAPVPQPTFTSPANAIVVRGVPTSPSAMPIIVQGSATVTAVAPSNGHIVSLRGPLPGGAIAVGYGSASAAPLDTSITPRGAYTYEASVFDAVLGCRGGTARLTVWIEDPTSWTQAQAVRVEGNIPINVVAGSIHAEPLDDLVGFESAIVVDRTAVGSVQYDIAALEANASHAPVAGLERFLYADARAVALDASALVDLATLCFDLTGLSACSTLPKVKLSEDDLRAQANAGMELVVANRDAYSYTGVHEGRVSESAFGNTFDTSVAPCPTAGCVITVGPFRAVFADAWQTLTPLSAEAYAAALRIEISEGPYRGEIVFSEAYAGISLGGRALLTGPTGFVAVQDDYASGADAPSTAGPQLAPGIYSGQFAGTDRVDSFRVLTIVGQKLRVAIDPAHRIGAHAAPVPTAPHALVAPRLLNVTLVAPDGTIRDRSTLGVADAHPGFVELNVDISGPWSVIVRRLDTRDEGAPYTVSIERRDIVLLTGDDAASCAGATPMSPVPYAGSMGAGDAADTFAIAVAAGEAVTAILKSDDLEGADLDLRLLDGGCNLVAQSTLGKDPMPKGEAERLVQVVVPPGTAFVQVVRVNGIGNYALEAISAKKVV